MLRDIRETQAAFLDAMQQGDAASGGLDLKDVLLSSDGRTAGRASLHEDLQSHIIAVLQKVSAAQAEGKRIHLTPKEAELQWSGEDPKTELQAVREALQATLKEVLGEGDEMQAVLRAATRRHAAIVKADKRHATISYGKSVFKVGRWCLTSTLPSCGAMVNTLSQPQFPDV